MALPDVNINIQDGALGILAPANDGVSLKFGVATSGTVNTIYPLTTLKQVSEVFGSGPLAEALALHIALSGKPVYGVRVNASVAGTVGAVTKSNAGAPTVTVAGPPLDAYQVRLEVTQTGALGAGAFKYSLDGGDNYSREISIPSGGSYVVTGTGLTLTFPAGTYTDGDTYTFTTVAPGYTLSDLNAAMDVVLADPREWGFVHVVGAANASLFAGVATRLAEAEGVFRYGFAVLEAADDTDANLLTHWANSADVRVGVVAGYGEVVSPLTGRISKRPMAWSYTGRLAAIPIQEDPGRVITGPVPGISSLYRNEFATPGLDDAGFTTFRTIIGRSGFYVTNGRIKAPEGSDFDLVQNRRVMDRACRLARNAALRFLNDTIRVDSVTGKIAETEALRIEGFILAQLTAGLLAPGHASDVTVTVSRENNILSDRTLYVSIRVLPVAYAKFIQVDIGFRNPANEPSAPSEEAPAA